MISVRNFRKFWPQIVWDFAEMEWVAGLVRFAIGLVVVPPHSPRPRLPLPLPIVDARGVFLAGRATSECLIV